MTQLSLAATLRARLVAAPADVRRLVSRPAIPALVWQPAAGFLLALGALALLIALLGNPQAAMPRAIMPLSAPDLSPEDLLALIEDGISRAPRVLDEANGGTDGARSGRNEARPRMAARLNPDGTATLAPAPDLDLVSEGRDGLLPVIAADGRRPFEVYARPFPPEETRPRIAIVLTGLGLSAGATRGALDRLPGEISLSFVPHADGLQSWVNRARARGHEAFLELPLEPFDFPQNDPGPYTLIASASAPENIRRLEWVLARFTGYVGVLGFEGQRFTASQGAMTPILSMLEARGLALIEDGSSPRSQAGRLARQVRLPYLAADRRLDERPSRQSIDLALLELETIARNRGHAVGVGFVYPVTVDQVAAWAATLSSKGLVLAPASALFAVDAS